MRNLITKFTKLFIALSVASMFLVSCSDDSVSPTAGKPGGIKVPQQNK